LVMLYSAKVWPSKLRIKRAMVVVPIAESYSISILRPE
jgi:hypothetical protein